MTTEDNSGDKLRTLTEAFHRLGQILPDEQTLVTVSPETSAADALELMAKHGYSQLPVSLGGHVLGLFSYRSFAQSIVQLGEELLSQKQLPGELEVEECMEKPNYAHISDDFSSWFDVIDKKDAILVGQPERVVGLLTAIDILRYLYGVASPFVLIAEIEISLRGLIRKAVNDEQLRECCDRCLNHYADDKRPYKLEEMTFSDYVSLVGHGQSWDFFKAIFRGTRNRTAAKLKEVRDLRNDVFHFKRDITAEEYERLADLRDWMLRKAMTVELSSKEGVA